MIAQIFYAGFEVAEITCPTKYFKGASSINIRRSIIYGIGVINTAIQYMLQRLGLAKFKIFQPPETFQ